MMNRALSVRSKNKASGSTEKSSGGGGGSKMHFSLSSLRGATEKDLSKKLYKLIKAESHIISAYEAAGRERASIASALSDWGEETNDDAISEISDKLGVLLAEIAEQEDVFAGNLEESRGVLKSIRNTERSVQPTRDHKEKVADEIQKLKYKDTNAPKLPELEQELVRAEAQSLVAEAQLTNLTRQKFKEAYDLHTAAVIERAEKQILLAKQARRLIMLLDDTPIVPGDAHASFAGAEEARDILGRAEEELREWSPSGLEAVESNAGALASNAMPNTTTSEAGGERPFSYAGNNYEETSTLSRVETIESGVLPEGERLRHTGY